ncbi:GAF domain-containing protein [Streptomyces olivoreticuli]
MRAFLHAVRELWAAGTLAAGAGNVAAYLMQANWTHRLPNAVAGAICTFFVVALPAKKARDLAASEQVIRDEERDIALQIFKEISDEVTGTIYSSSEKGRDTKRKALKRAAVRAAEKIGPGGTRSAFYELEDTVEKGRHLRCDDVSSGRDGSPETEFPAARFDQDYMYNMVSPSWKPLIVGDVRAVCKRNNIRPPADWTDPSCDYTSFVGVQVSERGRVVGLLTLDTQHKNELTRNHAHMLGVVAKLLSAGLRLVGVK